MGTSNNTIQLKIRDSHKTISKWPKIQRLNHKSTTVHYQLTCIINEDYAPLNSGKLLLEKRTCSNDK